LIASSDNHLETKGGSIMLKQKSSLALLAVMLLVLTAPLPALAQGTSSPELAVFTAYPSQVIGMGESVTFALTLHAATAPQVAHLEMKQLPEGWTATFKGGSSIIQAANVQPDTDASVSLKLDPPADEAAGTYQFVVLATSDRAAAELPLELAVQDRLPPSLSLTADLPTLRGQPNTTFRYNATLKNEGDEEVTVNMLADAPSGFTVSFTVSGQQVTSFPVEANTSKSVSIEAKLSDQVAAGTYPIAVRADGGDVQADLSLTAEVTGEASLTVTSSDGRLSDKAQAGKVTPLQVVVRNGGTASAQDISMSSTAPTDWLVQFDPKQIAEIPAGEQVTVVANVQPPDKALAGDYMITVRAQPAGGSSKSVDYRITVVTSTLWGVVGVALIAVAVGVVALAVLRFGRR
jgi:uncharacterized membrane protein